jgi:hypothetical protein
MSARETALLIVQGIVIAVLLYLFLVVLFLHGDY